MYPYLRDLLTDRQFGSSASVWTCPRWSWIPRPGKPMEVVPEISEERRSLPWKPAILIGEGLRLGGKRALSDARYPVFKGQNIFPSGLEGQPIGNWDGYGKKLLSAKIYLYRSPFVPGPAGWAVSRSIGPASSPNARL